MIKPENVALRPIGKQILILPEPEREYYSKKAGIVIPDNQKHKQVWGKVLKVGRKVKNDIRPGDKVLYSKYAGMELAYEGIPMRLLDEGDVFLYEREK